MGYSSSWTSYWWTLLAFKIHPVGFLPSSWLLNNYCFVYITLFCYTHITYVNIFVILIMLKVLSYLFLIFLFPLSFLLAFLFFSNLPRTTAAIGMDAGSPLRKSADLWCCCRYLHFFFIITSLYLYQVWESCLSDLVCFPPSLPALCLPLTRVPSNAYEHPQCPPAVLMHL